MTKALKLQSLAHIKTLWELYELALNDFKRAEKCRNVVIDMGEWYVPPDSEGECVVCVAGSVIREHLVPDGNTRELMPDSFDKETADRLYAINELRGGYVAPAFRLVYGYDMQNSLDPACKQMDRTREMPSYNPPVSIWWNAQRQLLADLKAANI